MTINKLTSHDRKIAAAALRILAKTSWRNLTGDAVIKSSGIKSKKTSSIGDKYDLLPIMVDFVTEQALGMCEKPAPDESHHDRLFAVLMARFDVLQAHRAAIGHVIRAAFNDSKILVKLIPAQRRMMAAMLEFTQIGGESAQRSFIQLGMTMLYAASVVVWFRDQTFDMSKTMAFVDKSLIRAGYLANIACR